MAAIGSIIAGLIAFIITKNMDGLSLALEISLPLISSTITYIVIGFFETNRNVAKIAKLLKSIEKE